MKNNLITTLIQNYLNLFQDESDTLGLLKKQIEGGQNIFDRKNFKGHVTASGLVISAEKKILMVFHNKLQKYLQPGGHIELKDTNIISSAKREVEEETNLINIQLHEWCSRNNSPILIDTHKIPKNKDEDAHYHHDFMFVFYTQNSDISLDKKEVSCFEWIGIEKLMQHNSNISRALKKMRKMNLI